MSNYTTKPVHISLIRAGDTVLHQGEPKTVCSQDIKHGGFMGSTLWGDSYRLGRDPVLLVSYTTKRV